MPERVMRYHVSGSSPRPSTPGTVEGDWCRSADVQRLESRLREAEAERDAAKEDAPWEYDCEHGKRAGYRCRICDKGRSLLKISDEPALCYIEVQGRFQRWCVMELLRKAAAYDAAHPEEDK